MPLQETLKHSKSNLAQSLWVSGSWCTHKVLFESSEHRWWEWVFILNVIFIEEGNGNPLQYSCLENLLGGGAW